MKRVLITGKNSYLGAFVKKELEKDPLNYEVKELDLKEETWKNFDFSSFDVVYHVAGLAHSTPDESQRDYYYKVNTELAYQCALKAAREGVSQFIFMSSIIVYGSGDVSKMRIITKDTALDPDNFYGDSKKQAEIKIRSIDSNMKIVILRPPMIYGPKSKGNYPLLSKFARKTLIFPKYKNERSMLFVGNLAVLIKKLMDTEFEGILLPQNKETVQTYRMIKEIAQFYHHKIWFTSLLNPLVHGFKKLTVVNKVFGNLVIDPSLSHFELDYQKYSFEQSIVLTEKGDMDL
ncbi:NAD-dependent epimerase/dehydratase family protein [uncultured Faecalicoccus sp.]|uniref:NAD-dependent epimerase/dehydratase family protein n=1 Tax=uncultured Faecalicoccus sp. TaxID=1971760 RepID=UPI0026198BAB|nr:NAD-dependent epimerase/dehydratase family protein [uncultured Faecalicoccus sp.]